MTKPTDMRQPTITADMIAAFDEYTHLHLDRRRFLTRMTQLAGSASAGLAAAALISSNATAAPMIAPDDPRISVEPVEIDTPEGALKGDILVPAEQVDAKPGVIVIHENRGLNAHIRDVARRVVLEGFIVFAPDFLSLVDPMGTPADEEAARNMFSQLSGAKVGAAGAAAVDWLAMRDDTSEAIGAMGFCWGGGAVNQIAVASPNLKAAAPFYGPVPASEDVANIKAKMLLHYAGLDERINAGIPGFEEALKAAGVGYELHVYEGVNHAFHNDTAAARYDEAAAKLAFSRTMDFFRTVLEG